MPGAPKALPSITPGAGRTLAQHRGLIPSPPALLTPQEWSEVQVMSRMRQDSHRECAICREDFELVAQILLSCSHVFHRACLSSFEKFAHVKCCPLCRTQHYQKRVISDGAEAHRHRCATRIQACWRGCLGRRKAKVLWRHKAPLDPRLRKVWAADRLAEESHRLIAVMDEEMGDESLDSLFRELDASLAASRKLGDAMVMPLVRHLQSQGSVFAGMQPTPQLHDHDGSVSGTSGASSASRRAHGGREADSRSAAQTSVPSVFDTRLLNPASTNTSTSSSTPSSSISHTSASHCEPQTSNNHIPTTQSPPTSNATSTTRSSRSVRFSSGSGSNTSSTSETPPGGSGSGHLPRSETQPIRPEPRLSSSESETLTVSLGSTSSGWSTTAPRGRECGLEVDWPVIVAAASSRGDVECPICLGDLQRHGASTIAWLSCSHCLHLECIAAFEAFELSSGGTPCCPVCRSGYQRRCF